MTHKKDSAVPKEFVLRLFVTGASPNSLKAIANIKDFCEEHLTDRYSLEIIDVYQMPSIAKDEQIVALPLLIKNSPAPVRRLIGDMSNISKLFKGMGIQDSTP